MISRESEVPPWRQLAAILRAKIASGEYTGRLPGERYLAEEYGLALVTVRKATHQLRDEGLIRTTPGMGFFVVPPGERPDATC
jgi:GntR family transcriptional regulator